MENDKLKIIDHWLYLHINKNLASAVTIKSL